MARARPVHALEVQIGAIGAAFVGLAFVFARAGIPTWIPPAATVRLGLASPLSGMTRSFVALARGDLVAAFAWHPLGPVVFLACALAPAYAIVAAAGRERPAVARAIRGRATWLCVAVAFAAAWVHQIVALPA